MLLASVNQLDSNIHAWFSSTSLPTEDFLRLFLAAVMGGAVGLERGVRGREAGLRTYLLVCLGSALVMLVSTQVAIHPWEAQTKNQGVNINVDPARIAYGVMTGVGFLGAGVIVHNKGTIRGLTTAAGLWCIAAVGLAVGFGMYTVAAVTCLMMLVTLTLLDVFEHALPTLHFRSVTIRTAWRPGCVSDAVRRFTDGGLRVVEAYFDRDTDPNFANIHLEITFVKLATFHAFERKIEADPQYDLMAAREV